MANNAHRSTPPNDASTPTLAASTSCSPDGISPPRVIPSETLFAGSKLVVIAHGGEHYRMMITKNGKLILQK